MSLTEANLEKKLQSATNSQDSIQTLSLWLLHHKAHHQKIVAAWLKVLKKAKISHRLTLFYLANDVIQNSKRKGISHFKDSFQEVLREATLLVRDEQIRNNVSRVFRIWGERNVYENDFIDDLQSILANAKVPADAPSKLLAEFKCETVIEKLRTVSKLGTETTAKMATLNISKLNATDAEIVQKLKDRKHGQQFSSEFDESARCLEEVVKSLTKEVQERNKLILLLEQSEIYYDTQRGEAKVVAYAYKNFGSRVKGVQKKLEELMETFPAPSPVPSPCPDAPSPTTSDLEAELELPSEDAQDELSKEGNEDENMPPFSASQNQSDSFSGLTSSGKPIPILSTFLNQGAGKMTSWLDAFPKKDTAVLEPSVNQSVSLDSRLSSLLQKIPNLPGSLQGTLLSGTGITENARKSPVQAGSKLLSSFSTSEATTPVKDECSGQNTPLQDEDISVPPSTSSFFSRLAAVPKTSQSPKDILKGLTDLIQTASTKEKSLKPEPWQNLSEKELPINPVSSFFNKVIPNQSSLSLSPPPFFSSPALSSDSRKNDSPDNTSTSHTSGSTLHSQSFSSQSATAKSIHENLSFIPTLVPSTPTSGHFKFQGENDQDEYDPSSLNFEMDVDLNCGEKRVENSSNSHIRSEPAPNKESENQQIGSLSSSRQSALITLVMDSSGLGNGKPKPLVTAKENCLPATEPYSSGSVMNQAESWPPVALSVQPEKPKEIVADDRGNVIPADPFFAPAASPVPPNKISYPNGKEHAFASEHPHSKIETVQSLRIPNENKWPGNDWTEFDKDYRQGFTGHAPPQQRLQGYPAYQQKNYHPNFQPHRYGWNQQERYHPRADYNAGHPHKRFPPPFIRGRGYKRFPHPY